jgi:hypothetical protein
MLLRATRFGHLRRRILSWCRRTRISASSAARGRNSPIKAHQINLQRSLIDRTINRFASVSQLFWFGFAVGTACSHDLAVEVFEAVAPWPHQFGKRMNAFLAERAMEFGIMP